MLECAGSKVCVKVKFRKLDGVVLSHCLGVASRAIPLGRLFEDSAPCLDFQLALKAHKPACNKDFPLYNFLCSTVTSRILPDIHHDQGLPVLQSPVWAIPMKVFLGPQPWSESEGIKPL
jgi:hypothetical protein